MTDKGITGPLQDRSRATRKELLDAAIASLSELGWAGSTVSVVAARAGVSRGALQHHFPTREDLFIAAVEAMMEQLTTALRADAARLNRRTPTTLRVVELVVDLFTGPGFAAALAIWAASPTEPILRERLVPLEARLGREIHQIAVELLGADESKPGVRESVQITLDLARGLALANQLSDDRRRRAPIVRQWASMLDDVLEASRAPERPGTPAASRGA